LITVVATDVAPAQPQEEHRFTDFKEAREWLLDRLDDHGIIGAIHNAQMRQEAENGQRLMDLWHGEPLKLCGHVTRYDIDPVGIAHLASARWVDLRATEARHKAAHYAEQQLAKHVPALPNGGPGSTYDHAARWITDDGYQHWLDSERAIMLGRCWDLAAELIDRGLLPTAYTRESWALITAQRAIANHEQFDTVRAELLTEIQQRRPQ
jgi:hypothetical protein